MNDSSQPQGYIHDGYTIDGYIAEEKRLYQAVRFTFRPMLAQERAVIYRRIARMDDARKEETAAAEAIKSRVSQWDLKDHKGDTVELQTSHILCLQPRLFTKLFQIVMGDFAPDEDPDADDGEQNDRSEREFQNALSGQTPEEADAKN